MSPFHWKRDQRQGAEDPEYWGPEYGLETSMKCQSNL